MNFKKIAYYVNQHKKPKFVNQNGKTFKEIINVINYPILKPNLNWTRNDHRFCSIPNIKKENTVTNLIDGNPSSMCTIPGKGLNWIIFDLKAIHVISKIRIYCW